LPSQDYFDLFLSHRRLFNLFFVFIEDSRFKCQNQQTTMPGIEYEFILTIIRLPTLNRPEGCLQEIGILTPLDERQFVRIGNSLIAFRKLNTNFEITNIIRIIDNLR
jgi:hypothetical protein